MFLQDLVQEEVIGEIKKESKKSAAVILPSKPLIERVHS